jgi:hypothetical protein
VPDGLIDCVKGMKMIMPRQFTLDWPLRIDKITGAIVCLAIGAVF